MRSRSLPHCPSDIRAHFFVFVTGALTKGELQHTKERQISSSKTAIFTKRFANFSVKSISRTVINYRKKRTDFIACLAETITQIILFHIALEKAGCFIS